jgi:hypothetical protein
MLYRSIHEMSLGGAKKNAPDRLSEPTMTAVTFAFWLGMPPFPPSRLQTSRNAYVCIAAIGS